MRAVHVEQYIHAVQHYVAVQMRTILLLDQQGAVHVEQYIHACTALGSCTDEDNSPTGPTIGAVHVEQYIHAVQHYVAVQMRTILLLDQQ